MLELDIAICTYGEEGPERVRRMLLPPEEGIRYVISWQEHGDTPLPSSLEARDDVDVFRLDVKGLSNNRNNALAHCSSDIVLIADDDLVYTSEGLRSVLQAFEKDSGLDIATFRVGFPHPKPYPPDGAVLGVPFPKGYWVTSMEIAFRREKLEGIRFNPLLGLGAPEMLCGEEELFMISAIKRGLKARHIGVEICNHPGITTGSRVNRGILMGQGCVMGLIYPRSVWPRVVLKAWRLRNSEEAGFFNSLRWLACGVLKKNKLDI